MGRRIQLIAENYSYFNGNLIGVARDINIIFVVDYKNGITRAINVVPEKIKERVASNILVCEGSLIVIPQKGEKIWWYKDGKVYKSFDIPNEGGPNDWKFFQACIFGKYIYLFGANYPAIVKINLDTSEYKIIDAYRHLKKEHRKLGDIYTRNSYVLIGDELFIPSALSNEVLRLNVKTDEYTWNIVGDEGIRYSGIAWDGELFWLSSRVNTLIVKWDGLNNYDVINTGLQGGYASFLDIAVFGDNVFCAGMDIDKSVLINKNSGHQTIVEGGHYVFCRCINENMLVMQKETGELSITFSDGNTKKYFPEIDMDEIKACWNNLGVDDLELLNFIDINEGAVLDLESYIREIIL